MHSQRIGAADLVYPKVLMQRCWAHKIRNLVEMVGKKEVNELVQDLRKIHLAKSRTEVEWQLRRFAKKWRGRYPQPVESLAQDAEELLNFYRLEKSWWSMTKTTNLLERTFEEVRRRTKIIRVFNKRQSLERILLATFYYLNSNQAPIFLLTQNA